MWPWTLIGRMTVQYTPTEVFSLSHFLTMQPCLSLKVLEHEVFTVTPIKILAPGSSFAPLGLIDMFNAGGAIEGLKYEVLGEEDSGYPAERLESSSTEILATASLKLRDAADWCLLPKNCKMGSMEVEFAYDSVLRLLTFNLDHIPEDHKVHIVKRSHCLSAVQECHSFPVVGALGQGVGGILSPAKREYKKSTVGNLGPTRNQEDKNSSSTKLNADHVHSQHLIIKLGETEVPRQPWRKGVTMCTGHENPLCTLLILLEALKGNLGECFTSSTSCVLIFPDRLDEYY
ncbi:hypothetical protein RJ639_032037 [Escallonia herrerae]|uniref:Uncharacterized protein n=1 Tax=Escallonia herrerae TaxID=1293975 RepID=A0AA88X1A8_9ASTE|nr:hypothetical protein RJ639_032037 [Escallonia herrerae]